MIHLDVYNAKVSTLCIEIIVEIISSNTNYFYTVLSNCVIIKQMNNFIEILDLILSEIKDF